MKLEFFVTGFWLAVCQVALTFHLLYSQGASIVYYFVLLLLWLAASTLALFVFKSRSGLSMLKLISLVTFLLACYMARSEAFTNISLIFVLLSVVVFGLFAGWFFKESVERSNNVSGFLLIENNGFILGYILAGVLLFYSIMTLDMVAIILGLLLFCFDFFNVEDKES